MNQQKFKQMMREFPFINSIIIGQSLSAETIKNIVVRRGDRNLLEVIPKSWKHDADAYYEHNDYEGYRLFWAVSVGESIQLKIAWDRTIPFVKNDQVSADPIGSQLIELDRNVIYVVEIHTERIGHVEVRGAPNLVIYKMRGFDWRKFYRPQVTAHN
jgi:hypothetical protein